MTKHTESGYWNILADFSIRDELDFAQRKLTVLILQSTKKETDIIQLMDNWLAENKYIIEHWNKLLSLLHSQTTIDYVMLLIAIRELIALMEHAEKK